jgi:dCTP deaminase
MRSGPWKEWIPGVLSKSQLEKLCEEEFLSGVIDAENPIDYSSIDLRLSSQGFQMLRGSVKPSGGRYSRFLSSRHKMAEPLQKDGEGCFVLKQKNTYVFKLRESLQDLKDAEIYGQATAKSSIGRMDVLARLIVDGMDSYDYFNPEGLQGGGDLYLEITPITFNVRVKEGIPLSQLRLFYGKPENVVMKGEELYSALLHDSERKDGTLSVDLTEVKIGGLKASAFCAKEMVKEDSPIDLWKKKDGQRPNPCKYWRFLQAENVKNQKRLKITKGSFYIIRSKEKIALPGGVAVYCRAMDEAIGEMRIHYAGFVHPFFGRNRADEEIGTPLIFEVRGHDVDVSLAHGEKMAHLVFYRMSLDAIESGPNNYNDQTLQLSSIFEEWSPKLKLNGEGSVEAV